MPEPAIPFQLLPQQSGCFASVLKQARLDTSMVNWDTVAIENGYKNAGTARTVFNNIKKKLHDGDWTYGAGGDAAARAAACASSVSGASPKKAGATTPRKKHKRAHDEGGVGPGADDEEAVLEHKMKTPQKQRQKPGRKPKPKQEPKQELELEPEPEVKQEYAFVHSGYEGVNGGELGEEAV